VTHASWRQPESFTVNLGNPVSLSVVQHATLLLERALSRGISLASRDRACCRARRPASFRRSGSHGLRAVGVAAKRLNFHRPRFGPFDHRIDPSYRKSNKRPGVSTFLTWPHFPRRVRKKAPRSSRAFFYFVRPEPEPDGVIVDPLGEALGPREFPDGL
jgi:hypothetical protein